VRIVVAPDEFTGTLSAVAAAEAIRAGWLRSAPDDELLLRPVSDGGPGFLDVLESVLGGVSHPVSVSGPTGAETVAHVLVVAAPDGSVDAYIESAEACGSALLDEPAPMTATSYGVGQLIAAGLDLGATRIVVGLGGTATTDGGAGLLVALGATASVDAGADATDVLGSGGGGLRTLAAVAVEPACARLVGVELVVASDVDSPLLGPRGAALGFGPQKGATPAQADELEVAITWFAGLVGRRPDGRDPAVALGAGAGGGQGYALLALGGRRVSGSEYVLAAIGLADAVTAADLVITGEGSFDWQSLRGKVVCGVAATAVKFGRPCLVLAGQVLLSRRDFGPIGVVSARSVAEQLGSVEAALADPVGGLAALAERVALTWSRG
jgi:glycerate kinase